MVRAEGGSEGGADCVGEEKEGGTCRFGYKGYIPIHYAMG